MAITILGNVDTVIDNNNGVINNTYINGQVQSQPTPQPKNIEEVVPVEVTEQSHQSVINHNSNDQQILDLLFRADDDDHGRTEILLSALIKGKKVKTKIVAALYEHKTYFNLQNLSLEDKTKVMNAWIDKLGYTEQLNGKKFTIKDW